MSGPPFAPPPIAGLEFDAQEISAAVRRHGLLSIELEMTHLCNLRCLYCYSRAGHQAQDEMSLAEIEDVVVQALSLGAKKVVILGGGEPLLYPQLRELVHLIRQLGAGVELFTNGTVLTADLAQFLYDEAVSVVIKRNSLSPQVQDELAGLPGTFARIETGLAHLLRAGYPGPNHGLGMQTIICRQNLPEIPDLWRWARSRGLQPYFECLTYQGRAVDHDGLLVSRQQLGVLFRRLSEIDRAEFGHDWQPHPPLAGAACRRHLYSILVKANGDLYPCVGVEINLGNTRKDRLADVLRENPVVHDLRHVYENLKGPCGTCRLTGECYGCRGNAFQLTGDHLASDPLCWLGDHEGE